MTNSLNNFKSGLYKRQPHRYSLRNCLCTCGTSFEANSYKMECPDCKNTNFKEVYKVPLKKTLIDSSFELIEKSDTHFKVRKIEVIARLENGQRIVSLEEGRKMELFADFKTKEIRLFEKGEEIEADENNLEAFSKNIHFPLALINLVSTEKNNPLYVFAYNNYSKLRAEKYARVHRAFKRLMEIPVFEILYNCGFKPHTIWSNLNNLHRNETKPSKIIGVPKYLVKYLVDMNTLNSYNIRKLIELDKKINGNNLKSILTILEQESDLIEIMHIYDRFIELYDYYGYKDLKKLTLYLAREVKLQQGIDRPSNAITYLRDYARMCKELNVDFEKHPKSLKKEHDIIQMNYRAKADERKRKQFAEVIAKEDYAKLAYKDREFAIVVPQEPQDVINEGSSLSHCVASYVNDIIKEKCKILFMRPSKATDMSLLTIEVRDKFVRQVKGKQNRKPKQEEIAFISKWAKKLDLEVSNY